MKRTVFAPAASENVGAVTFPATGVSGTSGPPLTDSVVAQPPSLGTASLTLQLAPSTAPVRVGVAEPPLPSAAVVKLDGHVPLATN